MKRQFRIFIIVYVLILLSPMSGTSTLQIQGQQGTEVFLPERQELEGFLSSNSGNDIFFRSTVDNAILPHEYQSSEASFDLLSYDGVDRDNIFSYNPFDPFQAPDYNVLYQASNISVDDLDLQYNTIYYDLTSGKSNLTGLTSIMLFEDEMSGFRFDGEAGVPLLLDINLKAQREILKLNMYLVSPSGELFDYSAINNDFYTFVNQFVPIVPNEDGEYTIYLSPLNEDIILENLNIYHSPPITNIESGFTARLQGTETTTWFFKFTSNETLDEVTILDLASILFYNESIAAPDVLLGRIELDYFTPTTGPFGAEMPATAVQWNVNSTYVAVTATPPNEQNQFVAAQKKELGLRPGFDVEFAFWGERFDVDEFTPDEPFVTDAPTEPNSNTYFWSTDDEYLIGMNVSNNGAFAVITNLDDMEETYFLDSNNNDILNEAGHEPVLLPEGNYLVQFFFVNQPDEIQIHTVNVIELALNGTSTYVLNLDTPLFFKLSPTLPSREFFNFTYIDEMNASIDVEWDLYDSTFAGIDSATDTFEDYWDTGGTNHVQSNVTQFGSASLTNFFNIQNGFMRVNMFGNNYYDNNGGSIDTNNATLQGRFRIERLNYLQGWEDDPANPNRQYENVLYSSGNSVDINGSKTDIVLVYGFASSDSMTGYSLRFESTNETFEVHMLTDWDSKWYNGISPGAPTVIDGIDHYTLDLEFGTTEAVPFAIVVYFTGMSSNGTFVTTLSQFGVEDSPEVVLGSIGTAEYDAPYEEDEVISGDSEDEETFLEENQTTIVIAVVAVAGAGAGALVILRRRNA